MFDSFNGLNVLQWNCHSIKNKISEFSQFLSSCNPDVVCLQETFLDKNFTLSLPNFNVLRHDRSTSSGGGVAFLVKKGISYREFKVFDVDEIISVKIPTFSGEIEIINVYCAPLNSFDSKFSSEKVFL